MKKNLGFLCAILFAMVMWVSNVSAAERNAVLKVYNWADYIDETAIKEFEVWYKEQTGDEVHVVYQTFDINEVMLTKIEKGHEDYDVVCPSEYIIERMLKMDMLLPLDTNFGNTPNYIGNISNFIAEELNNVSQPGKTATDYAVSYMWGTCGLLYNTALVPAEDVKSWGVLWNDQYKNKILIKDSYRDVYGTAAIYAYRKELAEGTVKLENLMNNTSDSVMEKVEALLIDMKPNIAGWEADFGKELMTKGDAYINLTWSGDAVWAIEEAAAVNVNLAYYVPEEGSNIWYDGWVIPKYAQNVKAANYFINFMCRSDIALRNMDVTGYVSAVATPEIMEAMQDDEISEISDLSYFFGADVDADSVHVNSVLYPDKSVVSRCTMIRDFGDETGKVLELWSRVKGDNLGAGMVVLIIVFIGLIAVYFVFNMFNRRKQNKLKSKRRK